MVKVLIAEDDLLIADMLAETVKDGGFELCGVASTEQEALIMAERYRPDLAVVDIMLSGNGSGTELATQLTARYGVGVLFSSGNCPPSFSGEPPGVGCLSKPYLPDDLILSLRIIQDIIETGTTERERPKRLRLFRKLSA